jgi:chromosomal replication initiation ATPase DnaA
MLSLDTYNLWFAPLRASTTQDGGGLVLEVANDFCEVWLKDNYMGLLQDVVSLASGRQFKIEFKVTSPIATSPVLLPETKLTEGTKTVGPVAERYPSTQDFGFNPKTPSTPSWWGTTTTFLMRRRSR